MVSLAICRQPRQHTPTSLGADDDSRNVRNSALWYPRPPPPSLNLNEDFLLAPDLYTSGYRPLSWTWFGGPGGSFLANLVKVRFICDIGRIDFTFNRPDVPTECQSFSRIYIGRPFDSEAENEHEKLCRPNDFLIDGHGGETINKVEVCHRGIKGDWRCDEGHLVWLKVPLIPSADAKSFRKCSVLKVETDTYEPRADMECWSETQGQRQVQCEKGVFRCARECNHWLLWRSGIYSCLAFPLPVDPLHNERTKGLHVCDTLCSTATWASTLPRSG